MKKKFNIEFDEKKEKGTRKVFIDSHFTPFKKGEEESIVHEYGEYRWVETIVNAGTQSRRTELTLLEESKDNALE